MIRRSSLVLVLLAALGIGAAPASAAPCETSWASGVDGNWSDSLKWTNGVPNASDPSRDLACITVHGTYTVTVTGAQSTNELVLGGSSGTQTLQIEGTTSDGNASLSLTGGSSSDGVGARGAIVLTDSAGGAATATLNVTSGTLVNAGTITASYPVGSMTLGAERFLNGNLLNDNTLHVIGSTLKQSTAGATWTNTSLLLVDGDNGELLLNSAATNLVQQAGDLWAFGTFIQDGGSFAQTGGTIQGRFVLSNLTVAPSGGVGTDQFYVSGTSVLGSDVGNQQTMHVIAGFSSPGPATLRVLVNRTNHGTISLDSTSSSISAALEVEAGTLGNDGSIYTVDRGGPPYAIDGNFVNNGDLEIGGTTTQSTTGAVWTNNELFGIGSGKTLDLGPAVFTNQSGTTLAGGDYRLAGVLKYQGANIVTDSALISLVGTAGIQNGAGGDALAGLATISAGASLGLQGQSRTTSGPLVDAGTVTIGFLSALTSTGDFTETGGATSVEGQLTASGGAVKLQGGELTGNGTLGSSVQNTGGTIKPSPSYIGSSGTLSVTGAYTQSPAGTLAIEITQSWPSWGRLDVSGTATLAGTLALNVTPIMGPGPEKILTAGVRAGTFGTVTATGGGPSHVTYDATSVSLSSAPTAVRVVSFSAHRIDGGVLLRWATAGEQSLLGFHLYREQQGRRLRLTHALIRARGGPRGRTYSWIDRWNRGTSSYWLELVELDGRTTWYRE